MKNISINTEFGRKQINTVEDAIEILETYSIAIGKSSRGISSIPDWQEDGATVTFNQWLTEAHPQRTAALKFLRDLAK